MPFLTHFHNRCLLPVDSSVLSTTSPQSFSILNSLRRHFRKKRSSILKNRSSRVKGSSAGQEVKSKKKSSAMLKTTDNYDMTILHDDELDNAQLASRRRQKKRIPFWANREQLQLAIVNQVYFQNTDPEDIFGRVCVDDVFNVINSIDISSQRSTVPHSFV